MPVIFHTFKLQNIVINRAELINASNISKKEFNDFFLQLMYYSPKYKTRDRQEYIIQKIFQITERFKLGIDFFYLSKDILHKLWKLIKNSTDNVIAGVVTSISALCSYKVKVSVNEICKAIGIRMSTVQFQVRERIFNHYQVDGFISLVRSTDLLKKIMEKLGLVESQKHAVDIVEVILGNSSQVFNYYNGIAYYFFAVRDIHDNPILIKIRVQNQIKI